MKQILLALLITSSLGFSMNDKHTPGGAAAGHKRNGGNLADKKPKRQKIEYPRICNKKISEDGKICGRALNNPGIFNNHHNHEQHVLREKKCPGCSREFNLISQFISHMENNYIVCSQNDIVKKKLQTIRDYNGQYKCLHCGTIISGLRQKKHHSAALCQTGAAVRPQATAKKLANEMVDESQDQEVRPGLPAAQPDALLRLLADTASAHSDTQAGYMSDEAPVATQTTQRQRISQATLAARAAAIAAMPIGTDPGQNADGNNGLDQVTDQIPVAHGNFVFPPAPDSVDVSASSAAAMVIEQVNGNPSAQPTEVCSSTAHRGWWPRIESGTQAEESRPAEVAPAQQTVSRISFDNQTSEDVHAYFAATQPYIVDQLVSAFLAQDIAQIQDLKRFLVFGIYQKSPAYEMMSITQAAEKAGLTAYLSMTNAEYVSWQDYVKATQVFIKGDLAYARSEGNTERIQELERLVLQDDQMIDVEAPAVPQEQQYVATSAAAAAASAMATESVAAPSAMVVDDTGSAQAPEAPTRRAAVVVSPIPAPATVATDSQAATQISFDNPTPEDMDAYFTATQPYFVDALIDAFLTKNIAKIQELKRFLIFGTNQKSSEYSYPISISISAAAQKEGLTAYLSMADVKQAEWAEYVNKTQRYIKNMLHYARSWKNDKIIQQFERLVRK